MIIQGLLYPFFLLIDLLVSLIPSTNSTQPVVTGFFDILGKGLYYFGAGTFTIIIANVTFWSTIHIAWAIIEWVYKKIPGVD